MLSGSVVSRRLVSFGALGVALQKLPPGDKLGPKKRGWGTKAPQPGPTQTQTKAPRLDTRTNTTQRNRRQNQTGPGPDGLLFLLDRFITILPGLPRPLSYRIGGYPIGYTNRADCRCERNAIPGPIPHFTPATSDVITGMGVTQFLRLYSSL